MINANASSTPAVDYRLYFVTDPVLCLQHGLIETAIRAVDGGATIIQLRDPNAKGRQLYQDAEALLDVLRPRHIPLIINDRIDVAIAAGANGVHMGQSDLPVTAARTMMGDKALIGLSIDRADQITEQEETMCDYFGAGPVYATQTKSDALPPIGTEGVRAIVQTTHRPVVAIGGIGFQQMSDIMDTGVAGVAVVSAIACAEHPERAAASLRALIED